MSPGAGHKGAPDDRGEKILAIFWQCGIQKIGLEVMVNFKF